MYVPLFPRATQAPHAEGGEEIVPHERGSDGEVKRGVKDESKYSISQAHNECVEFGEEYTAENTTDMSRRGGHVTRHLAVTPGSPEST